MSDYVNEPEGQPHVQKTRTRTNEFAGYGALIGLILAGISYASEKQLPGEDRGVSYAIGRLVGGMAVGAFIGAVIGSLKKVTLTERSEPAPAASEHLQTLPPLRSSGLGSLAQSARHKSLNTARRILLWVGILTVVVNGIFLLIIPGQVHKELENEFRKQHGAGAVPDAVEVKELEEMVI